MHRSDVIFARFDNIRSSSINNNNNDTSNANDMIETGGAGGGEDDGTVEVDLHFGRMDQSIENVNRAFNNPMFDANISSSSAAILTTASRQGGKSEGSEREEKL